MSISYNTIGIIHSPFKTPRGTPIQPPAGKDIKATVELFPQYSAGLKDLDGFSHIYLVYHFHLAGDYSLQTKPYLDEEPHGVFSTRAPSRPNPIGISVVRLESVKDNLLHVSDIDIVDGTPLLDIKPYVPQFEARETQRIGWLKDTVHLMPEKRDDGRFTR